LTWTPITELAHPKSVQKLRCFKEVDVSDQKQKAWSGQPKLQYEVVDGPFQLPVTKADPDKPNPKVGVGKVLFNATGTLLITHNESQPRVIWLWDIPTLQPLCVIEQTNPIKSIEWNPTVADQFSFCCGNGLLYLWEKQYGCDAIQVPAGFRD
jgi:WD40 repeat protein